MSEMHIVRRTEEQLGEPGLTEEQRQANAAAAANRPPEVDLGEPAVTRDDAEWTEGDEASLYPTASAGQETDEPPDPEEALGAGQEIDQLFAEQIIGLHDQFAAIHAELDDAKVGAATAIAQLQAQVEVLERAAELADARQALTLFSSLESKIDNLTRHVERAVGIAIPR